MKKMLLLTTAIATAAALGFAAPPAHATLSPTGVCPDVTASGGTATDCNLQIVFGLNGAISTQTGPEVNYDGSDDALIGVVNNSGHTLFAFNLSGTNIFGFEGDGINGYTGASNNANDNTGYGGPLGYFTNIAPDYSSGTVNFIGGLASGQNTYFSLEESVAINQLPTISAVPEPATLAVFIAGLLGLFGVARRRRLV